MRIRKFFENTTAVILAIAVHLILGALLVVSLEWMPATVSAPPPTRAG